MPKFDWTINFGHVLTIATVTVAMASAYTTYQVTINDHDSRLRALEQQGHTLDSRTGDIYSVLYSMKQDLAIIKYRLEQDDRRQDKK